MSYNVYKILYDVFQSGTTELDTLNNEVDCFRAVHDDVNDALRVNVTNLSTATETTVKDDAFDVHTTYLSGDNVYPDGSGNTNFFDIYLNRPTTRVFLPTNLRAGESYKFQVRQDGTGGREIIWGSDYENSGLTCTITKGVDPECIITVTAGSFDWTNISAVPGRYSHLCLDDFSQNPYNINGIKINSYDVTGGTITFDHPFYDSVTNITGDTDVTICYHNNFFFIDEKGDNWIGQYARGVSLFDFYTSSTSVGASSGILSKKGVFSNNMYVLSKARMEEQLTDDFVNGSDNGLLNWRESNSNGVTTQSTSAVDSISPGVLMQRLDASAADDGRTSTTLGTDQFILNGMRASIEGVVKFREDAFGTADVNYYFGWSDNLQFQSIDDGAIFKVIADGAGKGRVHCLMVSGGTVQYDYDTGIDLSEDVWYSLHIGKAGNNVQTHFAIDDMNVCEVSNTYTDYDAKMTCGFGSYYNYTDTVLPNNKTWFIDVFGLKYRMNQDRI